MNVIISGLCDNETTVSSAQRCTHASASDERLETIKRFGSFSLEYGTEDEDESSRQVHRSRRAVLGSDNRYRGHGHGIQQELFSA